MAKTGKPQTYNDVIDAIVTHSVFMPDTLLQNNDAAINANKQLGYVTREEFIEDAVTVMLKNLSGSCEQENFTKEPKIKKIE